MRRRGIHGGAAVRRKAVAAGHTGRSYFENGSYRARIRLGDGTRLRLRSYDTDAEARAAYLGASRVVEATPHRGQVAASRFRTAATVLNEVGHATADIAGLLGVTSSTVDRWLGKAPTDGGEPAQRRMSKRGRNPDVEKRAAARALREMRLPLRVIAERLGCSPTSVRAWTRRPAET